VRIVSSLKLVFMKTVLGKKTVSVLVTSNCYGVVSYKASRALRPSTDLLFVPIWVIIITDSSTRGLCKILAEIPRCGAGKLGEKCPLILPTKYLRHTLQESLTYLKILRHGADSFNCSPKEVMLRILSPLIIHRSRPGMNPWSLGLMASTITTRPRRTATVNARYFQ
jgi:hypothetical protein